jgi:hypothetical protein
MNPTRPPLRSWLDSTAIVIGRHFNESPHIMQEIFQRELGLHKFSRRWVRISFSECQNANRIAKSIDMLTVLRREASNSSSHSDWQQAMISFLGRIWSYISSDPK